MTAVGRLSLYWFAAAGALGLYFPYYALYLKENVGLSGQQYGTVLALGPLIGSGSQALWGHTADRKGARTRVLAAVLLGVTVGFLALSIPTGFVGMLGAMAFMAFFLPAHNPMAVSVSLAVLEDHGGASFGRVRVWGTLGFLASVVLFPRVLDYAQRERGLSAVPGGPSEPGLELMFWVAACLAAAALLLALSLPKTGQVAARAQRGDLRRLLGHKPFIRLLSFVFLAYVMLQGPMEVFAIYIRSRGGDIEVVGNMWIWMLAFEVPLIAYSGRIASRIGPRLMVIIAVLAGGLRWLACTLVTDLSVLYAVQTLHAVTVTGLLVGAPLYADKLVPPELRSTAQGLLTAVGHSLGAGVSLYSAGSLIDHLGPLAPYAAGGAGAVLLACASPWLLPVARDEALRSAEDPLAAHGRQL